MSRVLGLIGQEYSGFLTPIVTEVAARNDPYLVLTSCLLSLRTKDEVTREAQERLFREADSPTAMLELSVERIRELIYPVGFYRTKAVTLQVVSRDLLERFGGKVPDNIDDLTSMKGVGRKTANLVVTEGFGLPGICVDTHVHRICNRLGYVSTKDPAGTEMALREKLPAGHWLEINNLLVVWGQNVCRPISPICSKCVVRQMCERVGVTQSR